MAENDANDGQRDRGDDGCCQSHPELLGASDMASAAHAGDDDDVVFNMELKLITEYLNGHLPADQADEVERMLREDPVFYERVEPLLFAWSIPRHVERHPRPPGELEEMWKQFCWRAGIPHAMGLIDGHAHRAEGGAKASDDR